MKHAFFALLVSIAFLAACSKDEPSPVSQLMGTEGANGDTDPGGGQGGGDGGNGGGGGGTTTDLVIYDDDLHQGGAFVYPAGENQTLSFAFGTDPKQGSNSIRYQWNGENVNGQHAFAGFTLIHVGNQSEYVGTAGKNLSSGAYTNVSFSIRADVSTSTLVRVEVADDPTDAVLAPCLELSRNADLAANSGSTCPKAVIDSTWRDYTIAVTASDIDSVKDYFKSTFIDKRPGGAGAAKTDASTVYVDNIRYMK
jgi:hypothetical protein